MPSLPHARRSKAGCIKGKRSSPDHESSDDESAHPRPTTRKSKGHPSHQDSVPEANISTEAPTTKTENSTSPEPHSYLFDYLTKQVVEKHEKPVRDEYDEDLKAMGEGRKDDRTSLEEPARLKLQAGLKAVQPAIAKDIRPYEDLMISEYRLFAERQRVNKIRGLKKELVMVKKNKKKPARFTTAQLTEAHEMWVAKRISLGLPLDGEGRA